MAKNQPTTKQIIVAARKKLPLASRRDRNDMLSFAADDMAEAYEIGAAEAQQVIVGRLRKLLEGGE